MTDSAKSRFDYLNWQCAKPDKVKTAIKVLVDCLALARMPEISGHDNKHFYSRGNQDDNRYIEALKLIQYVLKEVYFEKPRG
jgi:hypothetical protein